jgi:hypothetical protein
VIRDRTYAKVLQFIAGSKLKPDETGSFEAFFSHLQMTLALSQELEFLGCDA